MFDFVLLIHNVDELFLALKKCKVKFRLITASGYCVRAAVCSQCLQELYKFVKLVK